MKNPWLVIGGIAVVLIGGSIAYAQWTASSANDGVEVATNVKGNPDADVVLVKYSDFECGACAQAAPFVREIVEMYSDDLRFEYKHFPVINRTPQAARAAEAAGQQGKFFEFHDALFDNFPEWTQSGNPNALFTRYAEQLDLDMGQWRTHQRASLLRNKIADEFAEGRALGVTGTPTFFLNGERLNISTYNDILVAVEEALGVDSAGGATPEAIELDLGEMQTSEDGVIELEI